MCRDSFSGTICFFTDDRRMAIGDTCALLLQRSQSIMRRMHVFFFCFDFCRGTRCRLVLFLTGTADELQSRLHMNARDLGTGPDWRPIKRDSRGIGGRCCLHLILETQVFNVTARLCVGISFRVCSSVSRAQGWSAFDIDALVSLLLSAPIGACAGIFFQRAVH